MTNKSVFFIPIWNQVKEFPLVLKELNETSLPCDEILLINNGSTDGSEVLVKNSGYQYIDLPMNRGVGYSFMVAIDWALSRDFTILGGIAANGKMLPSEIERVLQPILDGTADYVTGSRFLPGGEYPNLPKFRRLSIPIVNKIVQLIIGLKVSDATCGFKAMNLDIFRRAEFDWHAKWLYTYSFEYYIFAKVLLSTDIKWCEVPITMRYPPPGYQYSKIPPIIGWYQMLRPWLIARLDGLGFRNDSQSY